MTGELWQFTYFQYGGWSPSWILTEVKFDVNGSHGRPVMWLWSSLVCCLLTLWNQYETWMSWLHSRTGLIFEILLVNCITSKALMAASFSRCCDCWPVECLLVVCRTKLKVTYHISLKSWSWARLMPFHHSQAKPRADCSLRCLISSELLFAFLLSWYYYCSYVTAVLSVTVYFLLIICETIIILANTERVYTSAKDFRNSFQTQLFMY